MFTYQWHTILIAIVLQYLSAQLNAAHMFESRPLLFCTLFPAWLGCVYEVDSEWTVRNANTVSCWYIPECPSDCATCSFSILLLLSATCASSYNERVMPLKCHETSLELMFPGNMKRLHSGGYVCGDQVSCRTPQFL